MKERVIKNGWIIFFVVFAVFTSAIWFRNGLPKATGESGLLFATLSKQFDLTKFAWTDTTIGETPFSFNGSFPLFLIFKLLSEVFSPAIIQGAFFALMIFLSSFGSALLSKHLLPKTNQKILIFIGLSYTFNPYSIVFIWNRFLYNYTLAYTLMPLLFYFWISFLHEGRKRTLIQLFAISFVFSFAFTGLAYLVCFMIALALITLVHLLLAENRKQIIIRTVILGITLLSSQLFWILPFYGGNRIGVGQSSSFFSEEGNLHTTIQLSEYYGGMVDKLSQIRADMSALAYDGIPWAQWFSTTLVHSLSWVAVVMTLLGVSAVVYYKVKYRVFVVLGFLMLLLLINGTSAPVGNIYLLIYKIHPTLEVLRNPYEKAGFLFYLAVFIIWGAGLMLVQTRSSRFVGNVLLLISCVWWGINAVPVFNGVVFTYKYEVSKNPAIGFSVQVPDYYRDAAAEIKKSNYVSRGLALPITGEGITHTWKYGYDGVESYNGLFNKAFISLDTTTGQLPQIAEYIRQNPPQKIIASLPLLNVSDVVVRKDLVQPNDTSNPSLYSEGFQNSILGKPVEFGNDNLEIYHVPEEAQSPVLFLTNAVVTQNKATFDPENTPQYGVTVENNSQTSSDILYPAVTFSEYGSDELSDPLLTLPHVSVQRDSRLYALVKIKEYFWKLTHGYEMSAVYSTLSFKRLAEIDYLLKSQKFDLLSSAIEDYKSATIPLLTEARDKVRQSGGNRSFWTLIFKSQEAVLDSYIAGSNGEAKDSLIAIRSYLESKLHESNVYPSFTNKINLPQDFVLSRAVFNSFEDSPYTLRIHGGIPNFKFGETVQIADQMVNVGKNKTMSTDIELPLKSLNGKTEIRVPVQQKTVDLSSSEVGLGSLAPALSTMTWSSDTPQGKGEAVVSFEYKILKGEGPRISIYQNEASGKPILTQSFPPDTYDFDWKNKTITVPMRYDTQKILMKFDALPGNDCERNNPFDIKCTLISFRQVYDRHTNFLLRNVKITFKPQVDITLAKSQKQTTFESPGSVSWVKLNPALYKLSISNVSTKNTLVLLNQSHPGWSLYKMSSEDSAFESPAKVWANYHTNEHFYNGTPIEQLILSLRTLFMKPAEANNTRVTANGYANAWTVNENGTYILMFHPQVYLYVGWFLTIFVPIILFILIAKHSYGKTKKRHK